MALLYLIAGALIVAFVVMVLPRVLVNIELRRQGPAIDPNAKCPACGNRSGKLKLSRVSPKGAKVPNPEPMIEHTCNICEAKFYEKTVAAPEHWFVS